MNDGPSYGVGWSGTFCRDGGERKLTGGHGKRGEGTEGCGKRSGKEQVMNDDGACVS